MPCAHSPQLLIWKRTSGGWISDAVLFFFNLWNKKKNHPLIREIKKRDRRKQKQKGKNAQNKAWYFSFLPRRAVWICVLRAFNRWRNSSCPQSLLRSFAYFFPTILPFSKLEWGGGVRAGEFLQNENTILCIRVEPLSLHLQNHVVTVSTYPKSRVYCQLLKRYTKKK